jgi:hypothetical protein
MTGLEACVFGDPVLSMRKGLASANSRIALELPTDISFEDISDAISTSPEPASASSLEFFRSNLIPMALPTLTTAATQIVCDLDHR